MTTNFPTQGRVKLTSKNNSCSYQQIIQMTVLIKTPPYRILTYRPPGGFLSVGYYWWFRESQNKQNTSQLDTGGSFFPDLAADGPAMKAFNSSSELGRRVSSRTAFPSLSSVSVPCTMGGSHQTLQYGVLQRFPSAFIRIRTSMRIRSRLCYYNESKNFKFPLSLGSNTNLF